jgi:hypothetical protein
MARKGNNPVKVILRAVAQGIFDSAGFFVGASFVRDGALAGAPPETSSSVARRAVGQARAALAEGVNADRIYLLLCHASVNENAMLLAALTSSVFMIVPIIAVPIRSVKPRHAPDGSIEGGNIITDEGIIPGDKHFLILPPLARSRRLTQAAAQALKPTARKTGRKLALRRRMIIAILREVSPNKLSSADDISGKMKAVTDKRWKQECKARGITEGDRIPDRMTFKRAIEQYLEQPEAFQD